MSDNGLRKSMARFSKGFDQLSGAFQHLDYRYPNELEQLGLIRLFKGCFDSAWHCLRTFFYDQGYVHVEDSRDAVRLAFRLGVIGSDSSKIGDVWMDMIKKREQVELAYDDHIRTNILNALMDDYYDAFMELKVFFLKKHQKQVLDSK